MRAENKDRIRRKENVFSLSLKFYLSISGKYDYTMDYMGNVARVITRKYPLLLVHKKNDEKIKAYLAQTIVDKIQRLCDSSVKDLNITDITEISDIIAEYPSNETDDTINGQISQNTVTPSNNPSFSPVGLELSMAMDTGSSDIQPVAFNKPKNTSTDRVHPPVKPQILKRSVICVSVNLEVITETRLYLHLLQELPELLSLKELELLRVRITWQHAGSRFLEEPDPIEIKIVEHRNYSRWLIAFVVLITFCLIGITALFFAIPDLYKQDIHFMRSDTINQSVSIHNSRIDLEKVSFPQPVKDTLIIIDKKIIKIK